MASMAFVVQAKTNYRTYVISYIFSICIQIGKCIYKRKHKGIIESWNYTEATIKTVKQTTFLLRRVTTKIEANVFLQCFSHNMKKK